MFFLDKVSTTMYRSTWMLSQILCTLSRRTFYLIWVQGINNNEASKQKNKKKNSFNLIYSTCRVSKLEEVWHRTNVTNKINEICCSYVPTNARGSNQVLFCYWMRNLLKRNIFPSVGALAHGKNCGMATTRTFPFPIVIVYSSK